MTQEARKKYNVKYYEKKRSEILEKAKEKKTCEFCNRVVIKNNLKKHYDSEICKRKFDEHSKKIMKTLEKIEGLNFVEDDAISATSD